MSNNLPDNYVQRCAICGQDYIHAHYCKMQPLTQKVPWIPGTVPVKTLTEEDVRRIVSEELAKLLPNAKWAPTLQRRKT